MKNGTDLEPGTFTGSIKIDTSIDAPTEVHAFSGKNGDFSYAWYPNGFDFSVIPDPNNNIEPELTTSTEGNSFFF